MKKITKHYINGEFVDSHGQEVSDLISPVNGEVIGQVTLGDEEDTRRAISAAKEAFKTFSKTTLEERADYLQKLYDAFIARKNDNANAMVEEYGGITMFAGFAAQMAADSFLHAKKAMMEVPFRKIVGKGIVTLEPLGVAGIITPWNATIIYITTKVAAAIAAGCTSVVKPANISAIQTQVIMECYDAAGLPRGVVNFVNGRGEVVGNEISRNPDVAKISFTGSTEVGKSIQRLALETMKRVTLELGGKSPHIVLDDADINQSLPFILSAGFMNNGQACIAGTRILVPESRMEEFKQAMKGAVSYMKVGDPKELDTVIGPSVSEKQHKTVQGYIKKGIEEGAEILVGGLGKPEGLESGFFNKPTVFVNVTNDMTIAREEIFGPVLCIISYKTEEEAIRIANDTNYGLHAYISTSDPKRGERVANQINAGQVKINGLEDDPMAPFGGTKQSGIGREYGVYGIQAYLEPKVVFGA